MNINISRQIVLDTETTGMNKFGIHYAGHRVIEIGAVEIINRRLTSKEFHVYLKPDRIIDIEAFRIHGISNEFLEKKPYFSSVAENFLNFIKDSELIIHNAPFDLGFLNNELRMFNVNLKTIESYCTVIDSLKLARRMFPGQRNNLNALCERFCINRNKRNLHNALVDAQLLADVFLSMTGGQIKINFIDNVEERVSTNIANTDKQAINTVASCLKIKKTLKIVRASATEKMNHEKCLDIMQQMNKNCLWREFNK